MELAASKSPADLLPSESGKGSAVTGDRGALVRRPKVLHVTPSIGGGGAEAMLGNLVQAMHGGPWQSVVVAVNGTAWPDKAAHLKAFTTDYYDLAAGSLLSPAVWARIRKIIAVEKPDVVQTWMHHADFAGGLCAWSAGAKHIVWGIHCREIHRHPGESVFRSTLFRWSLGMISHLVPERIVSCSLAAIEDHRRMFYPSGKMTWIPNGISTERFAPSPAQGAASRAALGIPAAAEVIGYVGRFHEMKRLDTFFAAASLLLQSRPETRFLVCGGLAEELTGEAKVAYETIAQRDRVHFQPFQPQMEKLYPAMTVFSLSSRTEACPMTIIEAMACGIPCVTTDVGDCARLLDDAEAVVPAGDPPALARAWSSVLDLDAAAREATALRLRKRAVERFSMAQAARAYQALYESLITEDGS